MRVLTLIFVLLIDWSVCQHPSQPTVTQSISRRLSRVLAPSSRLQQLNTDTSRTQYRSPQFMHSIRHLYNGAASSRAYRTSQHTNSMYIDRSQGVKTIRYVIPGIRTFYNTSYRYISPVSKNITIHKNIPFHRVGQNVNKNLNFNRIGPIVNINKTIPFHRVGQNINKNLNFNRIGPNVNINKTITFHRVGQNVDKNVVIRSPLQIRQNVTTLFPVRVPLNTGPITNCLRCHCISQHTINIRCQVCCSISQQAAVVQQHQHRCESCGETSVQNTHHRFIHEYKIHHHPNYRICKYYRRVMHGNRSRRSSPVHRVWSARCLPRRY